MADPFTIQSSRQHRLSVCPHDTVKNLYAWTLLNTHVQQRLGCRIRFEPHDDLLAERAHVLENDHHLVYANPFSAVVFARQMGFIPVARPAGVFDGSYLVALAGTTAIPAQPVIASATDQLIVHSLGLSLLPTIGLDSGPDASGVRFQFTGNHLGAVKAVLDQRAHLAFVYSETWEGLSTATTSQLQVLARTEGGEAFHMFMVGAEFLPRAVEVREVLLTLDSHHIGQEVLTELGFTDGLVPVTQTELDRLAALVEG